VESVCTDPAAKGPTGPLCLVHLQMHPVLPWRCPTVRLWLLPCWEASAHSIAGMLLVSLRLLLGRAWAIGQEAERERSDPTLSSAGAQDSVYVTGYVSHCTGYRYNLVHTMPCTESRAGVR
jgi:hypothetical protein